MQVRVAPSLGGGFAGDVFSAWNVVPYTDETQPVVFFGLYGLPDLMAFRQHQGEKSVLWAGSDLRHLMNGYWLDDVGAIRLSPRPITKYLKAFKHYVENEVEADALRKYGIEPEVVPTFLGNAKDYELCYNYSDKPRVYTSVSGDDFELYKWKEVDEMAKENPDIEFHFYGNSKPWSSKNKNVVVHGRVSQETMNKEIKTMQGSVRLLPFEGVSELIAKALLWGQWPVSAIPYPHTLSPSQIGELKGKEANVEGRNYYLKRFNKFPW